jgi:hypothetical protein
MLAAAVQQRRNLGVGVHAHKATAKLLTVLNADQPCIVFRACVPQGQQFFEHDRDLDAIGCAQRIQLKRVLASRQVLLVRGS